MNDYSVQAQFFVGNGKLGMVQRFCQREWCELANKTNALSKYSRHSSIRIIRDLRAAK